MGCEAVQCIILRLNEDNIGFRPMPLHPVEPGKRKGNKTYLLRGRIDGRLYELTTDFPAGTSAQALAQAGEEIERLIWAEIEASRAQVAETTARPGVYLLILAGEVVYVGTSRNMPARVAGHRINGRPFDEVFYIDAKEEDRRTLESLLIRSIRPPQNRNGSP